MADEFGISIRLNVTKGYFSDSISKSFNDDMNIAGLGGGIQLIGTTPEALVFGDVAYEGYLYLENLDTTNIVDWGPYEGSTWLAQFKIDPGKGVVLTLKPGATLKAAFRTAEGRLLVKCYDSTTGT